MTTASVLIRAKDEARDIGRTLEICASQTVDAELIVVDSGSTDETVAIARRAGARVIEIPASAFTYGYALNVGCEAATADVVVALSAHAFPPDERWLERMLAWFEDPAVACVYGEPLGPDGARLDGSRVQDRELAERFPYWGYSNSAGGFRRELWEQRPFREDMPFTEDKEWAWFWLMEGRTCVMDPSLEVDHSTHSDDPLPVVYSRKRKEWEGFAMYLPVERSSLGATLVHWWRETDVWPSHFRARLSPRRAAELAGRYVGQRSSLKSST
jgi:rhamnosyltransferase